MPGSPEPPPRSARRNRPTRAVSRRVLLALLVVAALLIPTGGALGFGPSPIFGFQTNDGFALVSYQGILEPFPVSPGTLVFGDVVYVQFIDSGVNRTVTVSVVQNASGTKLFQNATFSVAHDQVDTLTINLASTTVAASTTLCVDGGCEQFFHQTPTTLIPSGVLNIGGLDLLVFSTVVEFFALILPLTALARFLTRKALWSPKGTLTVALGLPHLIFGIIILAVADYQLFDTLFDGTEFLLFPVAFAMFFFVWALHLFNVAEPALVLRPDPQAGHRLRFNAWAIWVGELPDGTKVLVGTRWRDWWARIFGHHTVLVPANADGTKQGGAAEQDLTYYHVESLGEMNAKFRVRPGRRNPLDDFRVAGEVDKGVALKGHFKPRFLYWVDSDAWLDLALAYLSFHRDVPVPAKFGPDGNVVEAATTKRKLSWPHYVDPPAGMRLAGIHYEDTPVAAVGWITAERAFRRVERLRTQVNVLRSTTFDAADGMAERQMGELLATLEREREPLSDVEAEEESQGVHAKGPSKPSSEAEGSPGPSTPGTRPAGRPNA